MTLAHDPVGGITVEAGIFVVYCHHSILFTTAAADWKFLTTISVWNCALYYMYINNACTLGIRTRLI